MAKNCRHPKSVQKIFTAMFADHACQTWVLLSKAKKWKSFPYPVLSQWQFLSWSELFLEVLMTRGCKGQNSPHLMENYLLKVKNVILQQETKGALDVWIKTLLCHFPLLISTGLPHIFKSKVLKTIGWFNLTVFQVFLVLTDSSVFMAVIIPLVPVVFQVGHAHWHFYTALQTENKTGERKLLHHLPASCPPSNKSGSTLCYWSELGMLFQRGWGWDSREMPHPTSPWQGLTLKLWRNWFTTELGDIKCLDN